VVRDYKEIIYYQAKSRVYVASLCRAVNLGLGGKKRSWSGSAGARYATSIAYYAIAM
jgi:hypothetical protein